MSLEAGDVKSRGHQLFTMRVVAIYDMNNATTRKTTSQRGAISRESAEKYPIRAE